MAVKHISALLPKHIHFKLKSKCGFYDLTIEKVTSELLARFATTSDFDSMFNLTTEDYLEALAGNE
jgi:hypothetical protein